MKEKIFSTNISGTIGWMSIFKIFNSYLPPSTNIKPKSIINLNVRTKIGKLVE